MKALPAKVRPTSPEVALHIAEIGDLFAIEGDFIIGEEIHSGLINATYRATYQKADGTQQRFVLQRINENVFKNPQAVMRNIEQVTRHISWKVLRIKKDAAGQTLSLYPARGGRSYAQGTTDGIWRCYNYIEGTRAYEVVENTLQAYQAASAFGAFQDLVSDLPVEDITETIPHFHNTRKRFDRLMEVVEQDALGRLCGVMPEVEFIKERENLVDHLLNLQASGVLPTRITHNDTKISNVLIDRETDQAVCVIDLDTVMPGLVLYDFGDLVRTATSPTEEDEVDLSKVFMQMPMFEALVDGYLEATRDFITRAEINELAISGKVIALEIGIRFLTDFLEGDVYFKTTRANQNLDRCRTQLKLVSSIEDQEISMRDFVERVAKSKGK